MLAGPLKEKSAASNEYTVPMAGPLAAGFAAPLAAAEAAGLAETEAAAEAAGFTEATALAGADALAATLAAGLDAAGVVAPQAASSSPPDTSKVALRRARMLVMCPPAVKKS